MIGNFFKKVEKNFDDIMPASSGESMVEFSTWIKQYSTLNPKNIFEIGANLAQDAEALRREFDLTPKDVWVFEPHPQCFSVIQEKFYFNAFDVAISNKNGTALFNAIDLSKNSNSGISSLLADSLREDDNFAKVKVNTVRMDSFLLEHSVDHVDFLKLDAEGFNFEILEGFGDLLKNVGCVHVEAEHEEIWIGQKQYSDISNILSNAGFELVFFQRYMSQSDSFWVQSKYLKTEKGK